MNERQKRTQNLKNLLNDVIRHLQEDCFDNEDKEFFFVEGVKILAKIKDINKAL